MVEYQIARTNGQDYIVCLPGTGKIEDEADALDLVAACGEISSGKLLIPEDCFSEDFFRLSSGVAGSILLKFTNYDIKVAAVLSPERVNQGKFRDFVTETNRGNDFRVFSDRAAAETWLTALTA